MSQLQKIDPPKIFTVLFLGYELPRSIDQWLSHWFKKSHSLPQDHANSANEPQSGPITLPYPSLFKIVPEIEEGSFAQEMSRYCTFLLLRYAWWPFVYTVHRGKGKCQTWPMTIIHVAIKPSSRHWSNYFRGGNKFTGIMYCYLDRFIAV